MFIRLFKNTYPLQIALIILVLAAAWIPAFWNPVAAYTIQLPQQPLYSFMIKLHLLNSTAANTIVAFCLILFEAYLLNRIVNRYNLVSKTTSLPAFLYVLLMSYHPEALTIHPTLLVNLLTLIIIDNLFQSNDSPGNHQTILSIGFVASLGTMLYFPLILIIPLFIFFIPAVSAKPLRETMIFIFGTIGPYFFLVFAYFMFGIITSEFSMYSGIFSSFPAFRFTFSIPEYITLGVLTIVFLVAVLNISATLFENIISTRRKYIFLLIMIPMLIIAALLSNRPLSDGMVAIFPASTILISKYLSGFRKRLIPDLLIICLIICIVMLKISYYA